MQKLIRYTLVLTTISFVFAVISFNFVKSEDLNGIYNLNGFKKLKSEDLIDFNVEQKFSFPNAKEVKIKTIFGKVHLSTSENHEMKLRLISKIDKNNSTDIHQYVYQMGEDILIDFSKAFKDELSPRKEIQASAGSLFVGDTFSLEIMLPPSLRKISINTVSADWEIKDLKGEELKMNNVSGDIKVLHTDHNDIDIKSVSGDYFFSDLNFKELEGDSVSGNFKFQKIKPSAVSVVFRSVSGEMRGFERVNNKNASPKLEIKTISGDLELNH